MASTFLTDLLSKRGPIDGQSETARLTELAGGHIIEPTAFEPDPKTHRHDYYYNARQNVLYKRIITKKEGFQIMNAHWKRISN